MYVIRKLSVNGIRRYFYFETEDIDEIETAMDFMGHNMKDWMVEKTLDDADIINDDAVLERVYIDLMYDAYDKLSYVKIPIYLNKDLFPAP